MYHPYLSNPGRSTRRPDPSRTTDTPPSHISPFILSPQSPDTFGAMLGELETSRDIPESPSPSRSHMSGLRQSRTDRTELRELKIEKTRLAREKLELEKRGIMLEKENGDLRGELRVSVGKIQRLEDERPFLFNETKEVKEKLSAVQKEAADVKTNLERQITRLTQDNGIMRESNIELKREIIDVKHSWEQSVQDLADFKEKDEMQRTQFALQLRAAQESARAYEEQYAAAQKSLGDAESIIRSLRAAKDDANNIPLKKQLADQVDYMRSLEGRVQQLAKENDYYRGIQENVEILREERLSAERQLSSLPHLRSQVAQLEIEVGTLRAEKLKWVKFLEDSDETGIDSPYALSKLLAKQRFEIASMKDRLGEEMSGKASRDAYIARLEQELKNFTEKAVAMEDEREEAHRALKLMERAKTFAQQELTLLQSHLKGYNTEESRMMTGNYDVQKADRIVQLEKLLEESKVRIADLEREVKETEREVKETSRQTPRKDQTGQSPFSMDALRKLRLLEDENGKLKTEKMVMMKEVEALDQQVGELERALGRGEYDVNKTRIFQLADNPETREYAIRQKTLDALKQENQGLRDQLLKGFSRFSQTSSTNVRSDENCLPAASFRTLELESEKLRRELGEKDKRLQRLKEVYQVKAQEYREAVYSLLGYKLEIQMDGRVRLTSMYAPQEEHSFLFSSAEDDQGTMRLFGSNSAALAGAMDYYITERGAIPAFLANVTLGLFEAREARRDQSVSLDH